MTSFEPNRFSTFDFTSYSYEERSKTLRLDYHLDDEVHFREEICFPEAKATSGLSTRAKVALDKAFSLIHIAAGISYYKSACSGAVTVSSTELRPFESSFFESFYRHGLGEFCAVNQLELPSIDFPSSDVSSDPKVGELTLGRRTAVPLGGGKDSIVTVELLKAANEPIVAICVGDHQVIDEVAKVADIPLLKIKRKLSPTLFRINNEGAHNGHVPITGILSFILVAAAILYDFDTIAFSNERSANVGNLVYRGVEVNHQYSKSLKCEAEIAAIINHSVSPSIKYFSLLRPLSELQIARSFSRLAKYFPVFASCNKNFTQKKSGESAHRWCNNCPKCRFAFLVLAPFIDKAALVSIFGSNLLDDSTQIEGYKELLGVDSHKPFECVGEIEESATAFSLLSESDSWKDCKLVKEFTSSWAKHFGSSAELLDTSLACIGESLVTGKFKEVVTRAAGNL